MCIYDVATRVERFTPQEHEAFTKAKSQIFVSQAMVGSVPRFTIRTDIRSANYGNVAGLRQTMVNPPWGFMLHHTAGDESSDIPTLTRRGTGVSSNDYINKQGIIFELVPFPRRAWAAGPNTKNIGSYWSDGNSYYWSIEIENYGNNRDPYPQIQIDAVVWRCRQLRELWPNIDHPAQVFRHRDYQAAKVDPSDNFPYHEVKARILAATDPTDEPAPPKPEPQKPEPEKPAPAPVLWLPGVERIAFSDYEEKHLSLPRVLTLDGEEKAVIVRKGAAFLVPKAEESADPPPVKPEPAPAPEKPAPVPIDNERTRIAKIINRHFGDFGFLIYDESKKANLHITSACALVEQESGGKNIFGADWGTRGADRVPFAHLPVTRDRVGKLVAHVRAGGVSNGIGLTQITWRDFIFDAENRGGAHLPENQCAVGFELLAGYYGRYPYLEAIGAYNAGESNRRSVLHTYSAQFAAKHAGWIAKLGAVSSNGAGEEAPEFTGPPINEITPPEEPPNLSPPQPKGAKLSKAAKAIVAAAVPVCIALLLWASTGTLDETELSVGIAGLLTALMVYFVPNEDPG